MKDMSKEKMERILSNLVEEMLNRVDADETEHILRSAGMDDEMLATFGIVF